MIEVHLGNIGSGKTACIVREIVLNLDGKHTFSNIHMPKVKNNTAITPKMIAKRVIELKGGKEIEVLKVNVDFWKEQINKYKSLNIVIDEAHTLIDARNSQTNKTKIFLSFLSLLRRAIGSEGERSGKLVLISQISRKLDVVARELATRIKWYRCNYIVSCKKCGASYSETNETPEKIVFCRNCKSTRLDQHTFIIEVYSFINMDKYLHFEQFGAKTYYSHKIITDIDQYFKYYNSYGWGSLLDEM